MSLEYNSAYLMLVFIIGLQLVNNVVAIKCFVCGTDESIACDGFDPSNTDFIKNCPPSSKSCQRRVQGNIMIRSCEEIKINDCGTANEVEYCFCSKDLCNGDQLLETTDDEDILEGSGSNKIPVSNNSITTIKPKTNQASIIYVNKYFIFCITLISIVNSIIKVLYIQY